MNDFFSSYTIFLIFLLQKYASRLSVESRKLAQRQCLTSKIACEFAVIHHHCRYLCKTSFLVALDLPSKYPHIIIEFIYFTGK
jgi:hypothetical protein